MDDATFQAVSAFFTPPRPRAFFAAPAAIWRHHSVPCASCNCMELGFEAQVAGRDTPLTVRVMLTRDDIVAMAESILLHYGPDAQQGRLTCQRCSVHAERSSGNPRESGLLALTSAAAPPCSRSSRAEAAE